nr:MAG TPA: hypothetical protein [Caudoviricetes sp.]
MTRTEVCCICRVQPVNSSVFEHGHTRLNVKQSLHLILNQRAVSNTVSIRQKIHDRDCAAA